MKKSIITISFLISVILFALPVSASADTKAGIKPGSFFYFFDTAFEKIGLFFTFSPEKKAQKNLEYADERLAEVQAIEKEENPDAIKTAITNYESNIALATEKSKKVKDKGQAENLLNLIANNTSKNQEVLSAVLIKVPEEAKKAITQAIEASRKNQEEAMKQIAELKGEVEQLKQEVAELKTQNEEQEKTIGEVSKQKPETKPKPTPTSTSIKPTTSQTSETTATPKPATTSSQTQTQTNETQNTQPIIQPSANTTNTTPTPTTQTQTLTTIEISSVNITPFLISARIEWQTNIPTNSKIFLSGGSLSSKVYNSESGLSTRHIVNATGLTSGTTYSYEIESIAGEQVAKKQGSFSTKPDEYTISVQPDKTSVPASGSNSILFKISTLKNGQYQTQQNVAVVTPDSTQNKTINNGSNEWSNFYYYPKTVGTHTLTFSWNGISKSIDIQTTEYIKPEVINVAMSSDKNQIRADGQDIATINVKVTKEDGSPIAGKTVLETNPKAQTLTTDANGIATFTVTTNQAGSLQINVNVDNKNYGMSISAISTTGNVSIEPKYSKLPYSNPVRAPASDQILSFLNINSIDSSISELKIKSIKLKLVNLDQTWFKNVRLTNSPPCILQGNPCSIPPIAIPVSYNLGSDGILTIILNTPVDLYQGKTIYVIADMLSTPSFDYGTNSPILTYQISIPNASSIELIGKVNGYDINTINVNLTGGFVPVTTTVNSNTCNSNGVAVACY